MRMKRSILLFAAASMIIMLSVLVTNAFSKPLEPIEDELHLSGELTLFAAASLTGLFSTLGEAFAEKHPDVTFTFNFAGSQQLAHQLAQGAPADLFASANEAQMQVAAEAGRIDGADLHSFARNQLQIVVPEANPADLNSLADLTRPDLNIVVADESAPIGQYTQVLLANLGRSADLPADTDTRIIENVVSYEQNVRAVLSKVVLGEADAGIVYHSDAVAAGDSVKSIDVPNDLNVTALYPIAPVADSENTDLAQAFIEFILSAEGQELALSLGFLPTSTVE